MKLSGSFRNQSDQNLEPQESPEEKKKRLLKEYDEYYTEKTVPRNELVHKLVTDYKVDILEMVLKDKSLKLNVDELDSAEKTPLMKAIIYAHPQMVRILIKFGANTNANQVYGWKPIHFCANQKESMKILDIMKDLVSNGARINETVMGGLSALHFAALNNSFDLCKFLLLKGIFKGHLSVKKKLAQDCGDSKELKKYIKDFNYEEEKRKERELKKRNKKRAVRKKSSKKKRKKAVTTTKNNTDILNKTQKANLESPKKGKGKSKTPRKGSKKIEDKKVKKTKVKK